MVPTRRGALLKRTLARTGVVLPATLLACFVPSSEAAAQTHREGDGDRRSDPPRRRLDDATARRGPLGGRHDTRLRPPPRPYSRSAPPSASSRSGGPYTLLAPEDSPFDPPVAVGYSAAPSPVDLDGDGDLDLVVGEYYGSFRYFENGGGETYAEQTGPDNPFHALAVPRQSTPTFVDLDGDGDLDMVSGEYDGYFHAYAFHGGAFTELTGPDNPFDGLYTDYQSAPTFGDVDGDGDADLLSGDYYGYFPYFRNDGGTYVLQTGSANPFDGLYVDYASSPALVDLDEDGDLDLVAGDSYGRFAYFRNDGGTYTDQTDSLFDYYDHNLQEYATLAAADLDGDGDFDLVAGSYYGRVYRMDNVGSAAAPTMVPPALLGDGVGLTAHPAFADLDGDGDLDLVAGDYSGRLHYFERVGGRYVRRTGSANPLGALDAGYSSAPTFVDLDGDGDLDLVAGEFYGAFRYYENVGGAYTEQTGSANPLDGLTAGIMPTPAFADLDGDGDRDLTVGNGTGSFHYFRNDGGAFVEQTGSANPFDGLLVSGKSAPAFVDVDGDGDLDLVSGDYLGAFRYFRNDGGTFTLQTGSADPFDGLTVPYFSTPEFVDLDGDGDLDLVAGDYYGAFAVFANGDFLPISVEPPADVPAATHVLAPPAPNPARGRAEVALMVAEAQTVDVALYDLLGRRVGTVYAGALAPGRAHTFSLGGADLPSGVYVVRVVGETFTDSVPFTRLR